MSQEHFLPPEWRALGAELRNWGRWGAEDQRGTTNFITDAEIKHASTLVRRGRAFDLGIPFDRDGPQLNTDRTNPRLLLSVLRGQEAIGGSFRYNDDYVFMPLQAATQWDALAHVLYDDRLYNDVPAEAVDGNGAHRLGIEKQAPGIVGRGVLLDVARHLGVAWLEAGQRIGPDVLDAAAEKERVALRRGDIVLIRTGWRQKLLQENDREAFLGNEPGITLACCRWFHERDVSAVAADNWAVEVVPPEVSGEAFPVHMVLIRDMGMTMGEMFDLEELAEDCAADGVYDFFFAAPVLKFTGAVGTPVGPIALK